jgi:DHA2 family multidrug resistance protein-like MFS transporter
MSRTRRWLLLVTVGSALLLIALDNSVLYTALPTLTADLGASSAQALWIINAYPLVMAGLLLGAGTLGDRIGHRRMFTIGLVIFGLASLAAAFAPSAELLIAARAVLAVGAAAMMPATLALIRITFTDIRERNLAIAVWGSISVIGMAAGPIVGGALLAHLWWGSVFLINIPIVLIALAATMIISPANDPDPSKRWDLLSSLLAMITLTGLVFMIKQLAHAPVSWTAVLAAAAAVIVGAVLFVRRQRRLPEPLLDFGIFTNRALVSGVIAAAVGMFAVGGIELVTTQRFQLVAGFTPLQAGLLVAPAALASLPTALLAGAFLHRVGLRVLISGGMAVAAVGVVVAAFGVSHSLPMMIIGLVLLGFGIGATFAVASTAIVGNVPARRAGMASSVEEVSYEFGSLIAVALLGSLLGLVYSRAVTLPAGTPDSAGTSFADALAVAGDNATAMAAARDAYDLGYLVTLVVIAVVTAGAAVVTARLLRSQTPHAADETMTEQTLEEVR